MSLRTLLVGPGGAGGEGVYVQSLVDHPPESVAYSRAGGFHQGAPGASCMTLQEILLNRLVNPLTVPDVGSRALRLKTEFDLVHVHAHRVRLAGLRGTPVVMSEGSSSAVYLGDYLGWSKERIESAYSRSRRVYRALGIRDRLLALDEVAKVYVFSEWARQLNIRWGADPEKIEVIHPGFETPESPSEPSRDPETFNFLFVGGDFERKGGFELLEAFAELAGEHPGARLTLAGADPYQRNPDRRFHSWVSADRRDAALAEMKRLQQKRQLTVAPHVERRRLMDEYFPQADAFVMPSHAEGFGFTNVEAMSFALPVISSRAGAIPEVVSDGDTGLLVDRVEQEPVAEAMRRLLADRGAARRMGAAGRQDFRERFTRERFRERLGDFYRRAVES